MSSEGMAQRERMSVEGRVAAVSSGSGIFESREGSVVHVVTCPGMRAQWVLPRPTDIMSLRLDNTERQTVEAADIALASSRYMASWLRQRSWVLPENRCVLPPSLASVSHALPQAAASLPASQLCHRSMAKPSVLLNRGSAGACLPACVKLLERTCCIPLASQPLRQGETPWHARRLAIPSLIPGAANASSDPDLRRHKPVWQLAFYAPLEETKGIKLFCDAIEALPPTLLQRRGFEVRAQEAPAQEAGASLQELRWSAGMLGPWRHGVACVQGNTLFWAALQWQSCPPQVYFVGEEAKVDQKLSAAWLRDRTEAWAWKAHVLASPTRCPQPPIQPPALCVMHACEHFRRAVWLLPHALHDSCPRSIPISALDCTVLAQQAGVQCTRH